jgi:hypothetical protein
VVLIGADHATSPYDQRLPIENFCSIRRDRRGESRRGDSHRYDAVSSRRLTHERAFDSHCALPSTAIRHCAHAFAVIHF